MKFRSLKDGEDGEYSGDHSVQISKIFAMLGEFFFWNRTNRQSIIDSFSMYEFSEIKAPLAMKRKHTRFTRSTQMIS